MRRMYSENQVKEIVKELLALTNGMGVVRVMDAPASTTLTDVQIEKIRGGIFINGTFLGLSNPILCPARTDVANYRGAIIAGVGINCYNIDRTTKVISLVIPTGRVLTLDSILSINSKQLPSFPSADGKTYSVKFVNGELTCVEDVD